MAPLTIFTTLASILALSASVTAQSGTGTGLLKASATLGAPYPLSNGTLPFGPTGTGTGTPILPSSPIGHPGSPIGSGSGCPVPATVTSTTQVTVTVTVSHSSAAAQTAPASVPYPIPASGSPVGPGTGTAGTGTAGTGTGTGYAVATGYAKRMEMRGLKQERKERKRMARFW